MDESGSKLSQATPGVRFEDWGQLQLRLLWCYEGPVEGARKVEISSRYMCAWLVRAGEVTVISGSQSVKAKKDHWLIPRPGKRIQQFTDDIRLLSLGFYANWPAGDAFFEEGLSISFPRSEEPQLEAAALAVFDNMERLIPGHDYLAFQHEMPLQIYMQSQKAFPEWFLIFADTLVDRGLKPTQRGQADPRVTHAVRILETQELNQPLKTAELARMVGLSPAHLERLFLQQFGHSPKVHFENRRIEHATAALAFPQARIKEVGAELGFKNLSHFSRWFQTHFRISPREYRRNMGLS